MTLAMLLSGCGNADKKQQQAPDGGTEKIASAEATAAPTNEPVPDQAAGGQVAADEQSIAEIREVMGYKNPQMGFTPLNFTVNAQPGIEVKPDLSNIVNIKSFDGFTERQREFLAKNNFVVVPSDEKQLFYIYETNEYNGIPSFITTDSILQLYHMFFDYSLRSVEEAALAPELSQLANAMLAELVSQYERAGDGVKQALSDCIAYFDVAVRLLGGQEPGGVPDGARKMADTEIALVNAAGGKDESPLFDGVVDYSAFTVRGHYTRGENFERYFKAMMWFGNTGFPVYNDNKPDIEGTRRAMLIVNAAASAGVMPVWENIYSPTVFYVGEADDLTIFDVYNAMASIAKPSADGSAWESQALSGWLGDGEKVAELSAALKGLHKARIQQSRQKEQELTQFRFMGQRYTPDSDILQALTEYQKRDYPSGLDLAAILGSADAGGYIGKYENPQAKWPEYGAIFEETKARFNSLPDETWRSNMYYGWLWSITPLFRTPNNLANYPRFAQSGAWRDKSLATGLASWTELRHDTVLYVKQSSAEMGGWPETIYPGYVEPSVEVYERLLWLTKFSRDNLNSRGILNENLSESAEKVSALLEFLLTCAQKELRGEALTETELNDIVMYGGLLESLSTRIASNNTAYNWYEIEPEADRNIAVAVDVHAGPDAFLMEYVGTASEIYVVTESQGKLILARGAVFDYFEEITGKRLTDEEWQARLAKGQTPDRPQWASSYISGGGNVTAVPESYGQGYGDTDYIFSDSDIRALETYELMNLTPLRLKYARNEIYARHGRKFNDPDLQEYFNGKPWYNPRVEPDKFSDDLLNAVEKDNLKRIVEVEGKIKNN